MFYCLSHPSSSFLSSCFGDVGGRSNYFFRAGLEPLFSWSQPLKILGLQVWAISTVLDSFIVLSMLYEVPVSLHPQQKSSLRIEHIASLSWAVWLSQVAWSTPCPPPSQWPRSESFLHEFKGLCLGMVFSEPRSADGYSSVDWFFIKYSGGTQTRLTASIYKAAFMTHSEQSSERIGSSVISQAGV